jgi:hypothetical protein
MAASQSIPQFLRADSHHGADLLRSLHCLSATTGKDNTFRGRFSNREEYPRSPWNPVIQSVGHDSEEDRHEDFTEVSASVRRSLFALLGYAGFCVIALGPSDEQIPRGGIP